MIRRIPLFLVVACVLSAQTPAAEEPKGVSAIWDVRNQLAALAVAIRDIEPLMSKVDPKMLADNGAPDAYVQQVRSVHNAIRNLLASADILGREPEKLPAALDVYFQMERTDVLMNSLREGVRKYQSPDLAEMLVQAIGKHGVHRDRLRQHISDLAELREQEYQIANEEAQRCRGILTKQPMASPERKPATSKPQTNPPQPPKPAGRK